MTTIDAHAVVLIDFFVVMVGRRLNESASDIFFLIVGCGESAHEFELARHKQMTHEKPDVCVFVHRCAPL